MVKVFFDSFLLLGRQLALPGCLGLRTVYHKLRQTKRFACAAFALKQAMFLGKFTEGKLTPVPLLRSILLP